MPTSRSSRPPRGSAGTPRIVSVLRDNGFTPEQYVGIMQNLVGALFAQAALEGGHIIELPPGVNQADVQFIADNKEWMEERWARVQEIVPHDSDDDDDYDADGDDG